MPDLLPNGYGDDDYVSFFEVVALTGAPQSTVASWIRSERLVGKRYERNVRRYRVGDIKEIEWPATPKSRKGLKGTPGGPQLELGEEPMRLYVDEECSIRELAAKFGVSYGGMHAYLLRNKVAIRPAGARKRQ